MPRFTPIVEIAPGATVTGSPNRYSWTDLTALRYVHEPAGVSIRRGRQDRFSEASADSCSLTLLNNGGRFVPRNPLGPWYGSLKRGTPLRVLMQPNTNSASDAFGRTASSSWGSADTGGAWTNSGTASDYSVASASGGRHTNTAATSSHFSTLAVSLIRVDVKVRIRVNALSTGGGQQAGVTVRHVDANNQRRAELLFAVGGAITARLVSRSAGTDSTLASATLSFTHSTSAWYWIRFQTGYTSSRVKAWQDGTTEPATWNIDGIGGALLNPVAGAAGCFSRRDTGNTNSNATTDFDDFSLLDGPRIQFTGFVAEWPVRWNDAGMAQAFAPITAFGQLRRLDRAKALRSAIYTATTASTALVAYWPMEDGSGATEFASGIGGRPAAFGDVQLAGDSGVAGSDPLPTLGTSGRVAFQIPSYTSAGVWAVAWVMRIPAASLSGAAQAMSWVTPAGSIARWQVRINPGTPDTAQVDGFAAGGGVVSSSTVALTDAGSGAELTDGRQLYFQVNGDANGSNIDVNLTVQYVPDDGSAVTARSVTWSTAATFGAVSLIYHDAVTGFANGGHTIGHVALGDGDVAFGAGATGSSGGAGDTTAERFDALLATQGITPLVGDLVHTSISPTQQMGPQRSGDVLTQLREVEATESGVMHDSKQGFLELLPRDMRYNRTVDLTLDISSGQVGWPFEPTDDDYQLRNDITVTNVGGSTAYAKDQTSIDLEGVSPESAQVSIYQGVDLQQHANWRLNLGTTGSGLRYPSIVLDLTRNATALQNAWFDTDIGSRIQVTNVPDDDMPPEDLELLLDGYVETITASTWTATLNCSPGSQYLTAVLDSSTPRLDCGASTLAEALDTTETGVDVAWTDACNWTHSRGDFPIIVGGERMTVTAVANKVTDAFGRTASSGWGTEPTTGVAYSVSGTASDYAVAAGVGTQSNGTVGTARSSVLDIGSSTVDLTVDVSVPVTSALTQPITQWICGRYADSSNYYIARLDLTVGVTSLGLWKRVGGSLTNLVSQATVGTGHVSGEVWRVRLQIIGSAIQAKAWLAAGTEQLAFQASTTDTDITTGTSIAFMSRLETGNTNVTPVVVAWDNVSVTNPQTLTVTRSINGIVKTHAIGEPVHVANPVILAL